MAYAETWWNEQNNVTKALVKQLVANGQLEYINGGWTMHDEANPDFGSMIMQTTLGHRFLLQEFNVTPKTQWQIDPFGHSTFQASFMSSPISGYNALFFMRDDYADMEQRQDNRTTEWIWAPSPTKGLNSATFAGILFGGYCTLSGLDMSLGSSDAPIMDDQSLEDYNVNTIVTMTVDYVYEALKQVPQGNTEQSEYGADIMLPLGCDFNYENAATWFTNTDKLIHWLNQDGRVNAFYSTPSIYAEAKLNAAGGQQTYTLRDDDLFPYGFFPHGYLTGFFTSRPALKGYIRETNSLFHGATQIQAVTGGAQDLTSSNPLYLVERAIATNQHHDAITGSSKQHVAYDYAKKLAVGRINADTMLSSAFQKLTNYMDADFVSCDLSNATICPILESGVPTVITFWNQQAQGKPYLNVLLPVGFPNTISSYNVYNSNGELIVAQILPLSDRDISLRENYYMTNFTSPMQWLAFQVSAVAVGYVTYFIVPASSTDEAPLTYISQLEYPTGDTRASYTLTNNIITLNFDSTTGLLNQYTNTVTNQQVPLNQSLLWYNSSAGPGTPCHGEPTNCNWNSGAYIFRPNGLYSILPSNSSTNISFIRGPIINEARQTFDTWATQSIRLWSNHSTIDFEWIVGPIPYHDGLGREIISIYNTNLQTNKTWYTDANGRDSNKRIRDYRSSYNYTVNEPISGNYYPAPGFIYTEDITTGATLSISPDRAEGGSSMTDGSLELMIHRRLHYDDALGVGEPLNETGLTWGLDGLIVKGLHQLSIDPSSSIGSVNRRNILQDMLWKPIIRYAVLNSSLTVNQWIQNYRSTYSSLTTDLPPNVHLLTVHSWGPKQLLLRLSHNYEANEGGNMANDVQINLATIFNPSSGIILQSCTETTLTANQPLANVRQWTYNVTDGPAVTLPILPTPPSGNQMTITLSAMDIRTFMCTLQ